MRGKEGQVQGEKGEESNREINVEVACEEVSTRSRRSLVSPNGWGAIASWVLQVFSSGKMPGIKPRCSCLLQCEKRDRDVLWGCFYHTALGPQGSWRTRCVQQFLSPVSGNGLSLKRGNSYPPHGLHVNPVLKYYSAGFTEVGEVSREKN